MSSTPRRPLRADAARNAERLVRAARAAFAEAGVSVSLEEVARRAGVGVATLYRRFPTKEDLVQAVLLSSYDERVEPAIAQALTDDDPWRGMVRVLEAVLAMAAEEHHVIKATHDPSVLKGLQARFFVALATVVERAQRAGRVRADLCTDDLPRLFLMLVSTMWFGERAADVWRRYLALLLDALRPEAAHPLPAPSFPVGSLTHRDPCHARPETLSDQR
ncbi:TetR/AcrR family transcriptional regulator [Sphaerisporangium fuscum]|uniref:TetR/AcrR family transcriptional regulator n=1 Tax=Sphaerisporangium fuscum TaxID=2835868 RepID=UPI001BDC4437|nr:TetR/AcrR family transcriptional regulator [Sphaerisporangium fuscum]